MVGRVQRLIWFRVPFTALYSSSREWMSNTAAHCSGHLNRYSFQKFNGISNITLLFLCIHSWPGSGASSNSVGMESVPTCLKAPDNLLKNVFTKD